jgi:hypothetical protein
MATSRPDEFGHFDLASVNVGSCLIVRFSGERAEVLSLCVEYPAPEQHAGLQML